MADPAGEAREGQPTRPIIPQADRNSPGRPSIARRAAAGCPVKGAAHQEKAREARAGGSPSH